jgi:hypothetical protein
MLPPPVGQPVVVAETLAEEPDSPVLLYARTV